jgi:MEMO1 family protein
MSAVRPAAVAGMFYPRSPAALGALIADCFAQAASAVDPGARWPKAMIVPHAGYIYSGPIAASAYARLAPARGIVRRVVLFGPAHRVAVRGLALPAAGSFATPLGTVVIDQDAVASLADLPYVAQSDAVHAEEHSLEVQLPFLQRAVPGVPVLPIAVGVSTVDTVADVVGAVAPGAVVLCSTDLSHYQPDAQARQQDERTARAVEALRPDLIGVRDACGVFALRGTVEWARRAALRPSRLALTTSADSGGDAGRVVGYPAFAFA